MPSTSTTSRYRAGGGQERASGATSLDILTASNYGDGVVWEQFDVSAAFQTRIAGERFGERGYAYVVTQQGVPVDYPSAEVMRLAATGHSAVVAGLPQVLGRLHIDERAASGRNFGGTNVFSAWATVPRRAGRSSWSSPRAPPSLRFGARSGRRPCSSPPSSRCRGASILLARRLVRPIKRLQVAAEAIGAGAYDERIELDRRDELGALATAFNQMAERVQDLIGGLERKVAERTRALEVASQHKSDFLANMYHELRTPLNAIVGFSQVLKQKLFGEVNEKQDEYLDDILSSADHLLALINDILDLSKVEAGQVELERGLFSLREALERGLVMVRERATKNGVQLDLELDPAVDLVEGDERRIRQVVFNLLSNAVKFTPEGGRVDVSTAKRTVK